MVMRPQRRIKNLQFSSNCSSAAKKTSGFKADTEKNKKKVLLWIRRRSHTVSLHRAVTSAVME